MSISIGENVVALDNASDLKKFLKLFMKYNSNVNKKVEKKVFKEKKLKEIYEIN